MLYAHRIVLSILCATLLCLHAIRAEEIPSADPQSLGFYPEQLQKIQPTMQALVDSGKYAGILTLIARKGKIVHFETAGMRDVESSKPLAKDTIFRIYSLTKPITSVATMILYEEGKLKLEDPISKFIPEFADVKVYSGGGSHNPELVDPQRPPTIADLLSHTSGLTYGIFSNSSVDSMYNSSSLRDISTNEKYAQKIAQLPLRIQPGTRWIYSVATDILGRVVEVASGQTLGTFFQARIFTPLDMKDTHFVLPKEKQDRLATLYEWDANGQLVIGDNRANLTPSHREAGGGGLVSTARDYLRFAQMLLNNGEFYGTRILNPDNIALMTQNHLPPKRQYIHRNRKSDGFGYGFAVVVDDTQTPWEDYNGTYYWWGIANTHFFNDPQNEMISMVWTQLRTTGGRKLVNPFQPLVYKALAD